MMKNICIINEMKKGNDDQKNDFHYPVCRLLDIYFVSDAFNIIFYNYKHIFPSIQIMGQF